MDEARLRAVVPWFGIAAIVVTFGTMGLAIALSPDFAVSANALSNLGDSGHPAGTATTELLFNGGLVLGGLLGMAFGAGLVVLDSHPVERVGAVLFVVTMASMAGVGVFPQDGPYHFEVAAGFYLGFSVATPVYGVGQALAGERRAALFSVVAGVANLLVWVWWVGSVGLTHPGLAIPELLGAGLVAAWTVVTARSHRTLTLTAPL